MHPETAFVVLFVVATAVAIAARRFGSPYTVALVVTGLAPGAIHAFEPPHLTKELLFAVFPAEAPRARSRAAPSDTVARTTPVTLEAQTSDRSAG